MTTPPNPPGIYVTQATWDRRFATRRRRVADVLQRAPFVFLADLGCVPPPPSVVDRISVRAWELQYIAWRDGGVTVAAVMGYRRPS